MKINIIWLFILLPIFCFSQNQWQTINYYSVSAQTPSDWENKNTENFYTETGIIEYQISCWSKDVSISMVIQWIDTEIESESYIELLKEMQMERFPIYKQLHFDEIIDTNFNGLRAKKCHFYGEISKDFVVEGEYIAFSKQEHSYFIMISGNQSFYKSNDYNYILGSINPNFLKTSQKKEITSKIKVSSEGQTLYEFRDYSLSIPNIMELRNENSIISLAKEIIQDKVESIKKIVVGDFSFIFQPVGTDNIQNFENHKKAITLYSRVLINYQKGEKDDYMSWDDNISYTSIEYNEINKAYRNILLSDIDKTKQINKDVEIVNIKDIKIAKNAYKVVFLKQEYERKGLSGNIRVVNYYLHNNNEIVKLTLSYRLSESDLWETEFNKIIDTFKFKIKKVD